MTRGILNKPVALTIALGGLAGLLCRALPASIIAPQDLVAASAATTSWFVQWVALLIVPVAIASIVAGIGRVDRAARVKRLLVKGAVWFGLTSALAACIGLVAALAAHAVWPHAGFKPDVASVAAPMEPFWHGFMPAGLFADASGGRTLRFEVFAVLFGVALVAVKGVLSDRVIELSEELVIIMVKLVRPLEWLLPPVSFLAAAAVTATQGAHIVGLGGMFITGLGAGMVTLGALVCLTAWAMLGESGLPLLRGLRQPVLHAFTTASSEATFPRLVEALDDHGVPSRFSGMLLPLGFVFNMCGSTLYQTFAVLFMAQVCGVHLDTASIVGIALLTGVLGKAMAGIPSASIVCLAAVLPHLGLPAEAVLFLVAVDPLADRLRTAANVFCNGVAAASITHWDMALPTRAIRMSAQAGAEVFAAE